MPITVTPEAAAIVRRSLEMARLDPALFGVRLREVGGEVMPRFAPEPEATDQVIEAGGVRIFVEKQIVDRHPRAEIGVSDEHERLVVRPLG